MDWFILFCGFGYALSFGVAFVMLYLLLEELFHGD